jgi:predicted phage-related endonuclease
MASLDRSAYGENRPVELKTAGIVSPINLSDWGEPGSSKVPDAYYLQCQQQAFVRDADVVDLAAMFGGRPFAVYEIPRNDAEIAGMVYLITEIWNRILLGRDIWRRMNETKDRDEYGELEMQLRRCAPASSTIDDARLKFPHEKYGSSIIATSEIVGLVKKIAEIKKDKSEYEKAARDIDKEVKALEGTLGDFMGDNETLQDEQGNPIATYETNSRSGYYVEPSEKRSIKIEKHNPLIKKDKVA